MENKIDLLDVANANHDGDGLLETLYYHVCFKCNGRIYCETQVLLTPNVNKPEKGKRQVYDLVVKSSPLFKGSKICQWCGHQFCAQCTDKFCVIDEESETCHACVFIEWFLRRRKEGDPYLELYYDTVEKKHGLTLKLIKDYHDIAQSSDKSLLFM
jgi:hypothetical protein